MDILSFLVWVSNFFGIFGIVLWVYGYLVLKKAKKENTLTSKETILRLRICQFAKPCLILFLIMKMLLILYFAITG